MSILISRTLRILLGESAGLLKNQPAKRPVNTTRSKTVLPYLVGAGCIRIDVILSALITYQNGDTALLMHGFHQAGSLLDL